MPCAVCRRAVPCWKVLRVSAREHEFPESAVAEGGFDDHIDGHLPLCGDCVLVCPTCEDPVVPDATQRFIDELTAADGDALSPSTLVVRWFVEPCRDPEHARPAMPGSPPAPPEPERAGPPRHENIKGQQWVADEFRGVRVGDEVPVPGLDVRGTVFEIWSHRLGGGAVCTIVLPDGSWVMRLAGSVVRAKEAEEAQLRGRGADT